MNFAGSINGPVHLAARKIESDIISVFIEESRHLGTVQVGTPDP
jgi:hypothetical protein